MLLTTDHGQLTTDNYLAPTNAGSNLRWNIGCICEGVDEGLRACAQLAPEGIAAIGVDGWAVDYVRLDPGGQPVADPFCYRDERTLAAQEHVKTTVGTVASPQWDNHGAAGQALPRRLPARRIRSMVASR